MANIASFLTRCGGFSSRAESSNRGDFLSEAPSFILRMKAAAQEKLLWEDLFDGFKHLLQNQGRVHQSHAFCFYFGAWLLFLPDFISVCFPSEAVTADLPGEPRKSSLSAAFHALLPLQLINRMKSPTHHLAAAAAAATFASCQIGETWTGKISPRSRLFKVISF